MNSALIVARKELLDLRRNRFLLLLLGFVVLAVTLSVVVASTDFRVKLDAYNTYVHALQASGSTTTPTRPQLFPLQLLRSGIEYVELIGALFAIITGYGMVAKERQRATIELLFSRPLGRYSLAAGKVGALTITWLIAVGVIFTAATATLLLVGNAPLTGVDYGRLLISAALAWAFLLFWSTLAMGLASMSRKLSTGLIVALVAWLVIVLIVPQIGDTMDPDNQVPGGLFKTLAIAKPDEKAVLANFAGFDTIRNLFELSSITKHFERATFAFLGIKDAFNQAPLALVWAKTLNNSLTLAAGTLAAVTFAVLSTTRKTLLRRHS
ncbi:MAG: ABC transporter permease [Cellulomonas sp.]